MFQGLLELLVNLWEFVRPWVILQPFERGVRVRLGLVIKEVGPGPHLSVWFIDEFHVSNIRLQPIKWTEQSITTLDDIQLAVSGAIDFEIHNIVLYELVAQDPDESLMNRAQAIIAAYIESHEYHECTITAITQAVQKGLRAKAVAPSWGIYVKRVLITDLCEHKIYRVMTEGGTSTLVVGDE